MNADTDKTVEDLARDALVGGNPVVPFRLAGDMHDELDRRGAFSDRSGRRMCCADGIAYRVLHEAAGGTGASMTQNRWGYGDSVPCIEDISPAGKAS